jgi:flagellar biosynthesis component FlhA
MNTEADMSLYEIAAELGRGLLTQLPSALLVALTTTGLTIARQRRRNRAREERDG